MTETSDRLWAAITPFAWDKDDVEEILTALTPVVDRLCGEAAAQELEAAATDLDGQWMPSPQWDFPRALRTRAEELRARVAP